MAQGSGSAVGAMFDSQNGYLTLDHAVELTMRRGGEPVEIDAQHAECDRDRQVCTLRGARVDYRGGKATAAEARIQFRADGTAQQFDATSGFTAETATGGHLAAPTAQMDFNENNQPLHGHLEGGVTMDSTNSGQSMQGSAPAAELAFTAQGQLRQAEFEHGVVFNTQETNQASSGEAEALRGETLLALAAGRGELQRWRQGASGARKPARHGRRGCNQREPAWRRRRDARQDERRPGDRDVRAGIGPALAYRRWPRVNRRNQRDRSAADGKRRPARGGIQADQRSGTEDQKTESQGARGSAPASGTADLQSAELDGHVVVFEQPAARSGAQPQPPIHASAGKAEYEQTGQWVHLTIDPRVEYNGLELTADKVDVSQQSGDAFAHGNVKATWISTGADGTEDAAASKSGGKAPLSFGGKGVAHVVAAEAELNQLTGEATFRGHARLWQVANSVSAPLIVLNQHLQTLVARSSDTGDPVKLALMSAGGPAEGLGASSLTGRKANQQGGCETRGYGTSGCGCHPGTWGRPVVLPGRRPRGDSQAVCWAQSLRKLRRRRHLQMKLTCG